MTEKGIVFGKGFLGTKIAKEFGYKLVGREVDPLNISVLNDFLNREKPAIVINAIGKTGRPNIDWCEKNKEETLLSNIAAAVILASVCSEKGIYFVHIGSGCVYQGDKNGGGYSETDEPNNLSNIYARSKIYSEKILKDFPCLQLRIRMPIDDSPHDRNFIDKVSKYTKVIDVQNSMTCIPDFLEVMKKLIAKKAVGIYNVTNPGDITPAEIMTIYREIINPNHKFEVINSKQLDELTTAKRSNCVLNTNKLSSEGIQMLEIHAAVRKCLTNYKKYAGGIN